MLTVGRGALASVGAEQRRHATQVGGAEAAGGGAREQSHCVGDKSQQSGWRVSVNTLFSQTHTLARCDYTDRQAQTQTHLHTQTAAESHYLPAVLTHAHAHKPTPTHTHTDTHTLSLSAPPRQRPV